MTKEMTIVFIDKHSIAWELVTETKEWYIIRDRFGAEHPKKKCFTKDWRKCERERR